MQARSFRELRLKLNEMVTLHEMNGNSVLFLHVSREARPTGLRVRRKVQADEVILQVVKVAHDLATNAMLGEDLDSGEC